MAGKIFQIYQITGKCICESKIESGCFYSRPQRNPGYYHHPEQSKITIPLGSVFLFDSLPTPRGEETMVQLYSKFMS